MTVTTSYSFTTSQSRFYGGASASTKANFSPIQASIGKNPVSDSYVTSFATVLDPTAINIGGTVVRANASQLGVFTDNRVALAIQTSNDIMLNVYSDDFSRPSVQPIATGVDLQTHPSVTGLRDGGAVVAYTTTTQGAFIDIGAVKATIPEQRSLNAGGNHDVAVGI